MSRLEYINLNRGTLIFRAAPNICDYDTPQKILANIRKCQDSKKFGIYFGNNPLISLSMCFEYDKLMELGVFEVTEDISVAKGKTSFLFKLPKERRSVATFQEERQPSENISHIGCEISISILESNRFKNNDDIKNLISKFYIKENCEIFLTNLTNDLTKIKLIKSYKLNDELIKSTDDLLHYIKSLNFSFTLDKYLESNILLEINCKEVMKIIIEKLKKNIIKLLDNKFENKNYQIKEEIDEAFRRF